MLHGLPNIPLQLPDSQERAREELTKLLRDHPGIEECLNCKEGCSDLQLLESLLKHDSPFALLRSLGFSSDTASLASRLLKDSALTPRVRDLARNIEDKLTPRAAPSPGRTPVMRHSGMADCTDSVFDWRAQALTPKRTQLRQPAEGTPRCASRFEVGQTVRAAFCEDGLRILGVVTCVEPLEVRPDGMADSFPFAVVEAVDVVAPDKRAIKTPDRVCDLRALEMATLCIQQGLPQMAKVYLSMVTINDGGLDVEKLVSECAGCPGRGDVSPYATLENTLEAPKTPEALRKAPDVPKLWLSGIPTMVSIAEEREVSMGDEGPKEAREYCAAQERVPGPAPTSPVRSPVGVNAASGHEVEVPARSGSAPGGQVCAPLPCFELGVTGPIHVAGGEATVVNGEGAPVTLGADGVHYYCGRPRSVANAAAVDDGPRCLCCGPRDGAQCCSCKHFQLHVQVMQSLFEVGQRVRFADHEADEWKEGVVTEVSPLMVRPHGFRESFEFNLVEPLDSLAVSETEADSSNIQRMLRAELAVAGLPTKWRSDAISGTQTSSKPDAAEVQDGVSEEGKHDGCSIDPDNDLASSLAMWTARSTCSLPGIPPWHQLAKTIETRAAGRAPASPQAGLSRTGPDLARALLRSPGEARGVGSAWLSCCFAR